MLTNEMILNETNNNQLDAWMAEYIMGWPIVANPKDGEGVPFYWYGYVYKRPQLGMPWSPTSSYDNLFECQERVNAKWALTIAHIPTSSEWEVLIQVPNANHYAVTCNNDLRIALTKAILYTTVEE